MTRHEATVKVLQENMRPMSSGEIATDVNERKLFVKKDGLEIKSNQIRARVNNYPKLFTWNGSEISLVH